jgi:hypothetical protein
LAVLVRDRHLSIAGDLAFARRFRLRRLLAVLVCGLGAGLTALGAALDEPGTVKT